MGLFNKIFKKEKTTQHYNNSVNKKSELDKLKEREKIQDMKMGNKDYYFSEESKIEAKKINQLKEEYLQKNPKAYELIGADVFYYYWYGIPKNNERNIFKLVGEAKYNENQGNYEKALKLYQQADDLTMKLCGDEIQELIRSHGSGDYLYTAKIRPRIKLCKNRIFKNKYKALEDEAKSLEDVNPSKSIELYNELNVLRPGLKKYNKRIEIVNRKLSRKKGGL